MTEDSSLNLIGLAAVIALLLLNGFFVAAEYSMVRVRRTRLEELAGQGVVPARYALKVVDDLKRYIATTQLAITMAGIGLGWVGEPALTGLLSSLLNVPLSALDPLLRRTLSSLISFSLVTYLTVVTSELVPKSLTITYPEKVALLVSRFVVLTGTAFRPFIWLLTTSSSLILRALGLRSTEPGGAAHSVEELKLLLAESRESGVIEDAEQDMLDAVFDFGDTLVRQVMVPRTEMVAVPADAPLSEIVRVAGEHRFGRIPVYEGSVDQVIGLVHVADLLRLWSEGEPDGRTARDLMRETLYVPETASIAILLARFRRRRQHVAIVLDEFGGTAGIVSLSDLVEEIVGEVSDPFDEPDFLPLPDGTVLIDGLTPIEEVNEHFGLRLDDPHYDTLAGFVLGRLGRLAQVGDRVSVGEAELRVEALDGLRIARVSLLRRSSGDTSPPAT